MPKRREQIKLTIGPFRDFDDYKSCIEIQREVWRFDDLDIIPVPMLIVMDHYGGILLGAYNALGEMIGFVCSILGSQDGRLIQHSHMLAVRDAYRNVDVGFKLKLAQRKEALRRKIDCITWTFDPMMPLNAYFNLAKLGAETNTYELNYYGETTSALHRGLPTDRFVARWDLRSKSVRKRLADGPPRHDLRRVLKNYTIINELANPSPGISTCASVQLDSTARQLLFEIPFHLPDIRSRDRDVARDWQSRMRKVFRGYFRKGYGATDFWIAKHQGKRRGFYLLEKLDGHLGSQ